ncbi:hypothetical protein B296_00055222 [Ensete ventricosum]|uniref:Uncharacterized protein n=1 Tax=Ensete ventricosum TaxID=4639 RepID=A0A426WYY7_ENSVE|nr:hypothetical protein B296_00055222 [Ensete ventricosum]
MGGRPRRGHLQGGDRLWPRPTAKRRLATAKAPCTGGDRLQPAHKGGKRLRARSLAARRPLGAARSWRGRRGSAHPAASSQRGSTRRLHKGIDGGGSGAEREEEDLGHSF